MPTHLIFGKKHNYRIRKYILSTNNAEVFNLVKILQIYLCILLTFIVSRVQHVLMCPVCNHDSPELHVL